MPSTMESTLVFILLNQKLQHQLYVTSIICDLNNTCTEVYVKSEQYAYKTNIQKKNISKIKKAHFIGFHCKVYNHKESRYFYKKHLPKRHNAVKLLTHKI